MLIGIVVVRDYPKKDAFTIEEIAAVSIIFALAVSVFQKVKIAGFGINYIFIVLLLVYIGFKYGISFGCLCGLAISASILLVSNISTFQIIILIVSGILAGILAHILTPKKFVRKRINSETLLGNKGEHRLNYYEEIKDKLNAVAQTISDMNHNFFIRNGNNVDLLNQEVYIDNFLNMLENYTENIFYEDLIRNEKIIGDFFDSLKKNDIITEKDMMDIFKKYNIFILLRDQKLKNDLQDVIKVANRVYRELQINSVKAEIKREEAEKLENELNNVTNIIKNITKDEKELNKYENKEKEIKTLLKGKMYAIKNVNVDMLRNGKFFVKLNFGSNNEVLKEKSKISNIEVLISKCLNTKIVFQKDKKILSTGEYYQIYSSEDKFGLQLGCTKISKDMSGNISGDSNLQVRLEDGKYLLAISDGMGSGEKAKKASKFVINSLSTMLLKGFNQEDTIRLINSELNFNRDDDMYASLDMSVLDLFLGNLIISKNGACNTYLKSKNGVKVYKGSNLPVGIVRDSCLATENISLNEGDIILMCSDGLLDAGRGEKNDWIENFLNSISTNSVQKIADLIAGEAIDKSYGTPKDDITVIVAKIIKKT